MFITSKKNKEVDILTLETTVFLLKVTYINKKKKKVLVEKTYKVNSKKNITNWSYQKKKQQQKKRE
ncbi:hypothetical protein RFI_27456 [Reticulomyxa filosa]|uniref:Uncharacterized protein n=1 Tax=Reticulomyxa filosa TaxID=46433 RepID=X6M8H4_RETFI|nr:hypothetical protein RFI_27456 [Reticulomyxa filosa]|eukprot:ETO09921.1 hypothetical protein RFI_27456 [Reticulomyxa filosa]